ncbi:MAG: 8-amino-7-oxononanoate synthase [Candidatus Omnitrophica bacterium]|nr:8-amino-7-oxononanoate synthase [Candidatus Omnitrophota bacterium]
MPVNNISNLDRLCAEFLDGLGAAGKRRGLKTIQSPQQSRIKCQGQVFLNFCSNNYLGLADHALIKSAARESLGNEGFGAGASRLVCGHLNAHQELESALARFHHREAALLFSTGYMANTGVISSVCHQHDVILADKLVHASIIDGIILSRAQFHRYPHCDTEALERLLIKHKDIPKKLIVTDSVFSMDGDVAPLKDIVALAKKHQAILMVDEAHALGVFGAHGRGLAEALQVEDDIDIIVATLSKSAGSFGAYVTGSRMLIDFLINKARSFIYTTGLPPSIAAASLKGLEIICSDHERRKRLWDNTDYLNNALTENGFDTLNSSSPIIPVLVGEESLAVEFSKRLLADGIYITPIRPPTVPPGTSRLRITVSAEHTREDLDYLIEKMKEIGKQACLI